MSHQSFGDVKNIKMISEYINETKTILNKLSEDECIQSQIDEVAKLILDTVLSGHKVFVAGNGGSASDSQHFVAELLSKFSKIRKPLPAISLNSDISVLTAISNDFGYENVFARQLEALASKDDIFIAISTSGNSKNIINSIQKAREISLKVVGFTGENKGKMNFYCDYLISVPAKKTSHIQECHITIIHSICTFIENHIL